MPDFRFHDVDKSAYFPQKAVLELTRHLQKNERRYHCSPLTIWQRCGKLPGLGQVVEEIPWTRYAPEVAYQYLYLFMAYAYDDLTPDKRAAKWDWVRNHAGQIDDLLRSVSPDYQAKCVSHLRDFLWIWDSAQALTRLMPAAYELIRRLAQPPYKTMCDTADVTCDFLGSLRGEVLSRFLSAPDASFQRLEEACRLENNTRLIGRGTWSLTRHLPESAVDCFLYYPAKLFKVAKVLGGLPEEIRERVTRDFSLSPLMEGSLEQKAVADAVAIIESNRLEGVFNPVPRKLQDHVAGRRTLNGPQIALSWDQMNRQLALTRLETLECRVLAALQGVFPADPVEKSARHALTMYHAADENRRALGKFLKAYWNGQRHYIARHPLNQAWLTRHPAIDIEIWGQGIISEGESAAHGALRLVVEQDPLEALKLGTYVGSCLGIGGSFSYSAVAAVLDINKQIIYARDAKGNVVARQLLALSEQGQLVCYGVYPLSTPEDICRMFAEYDRLFAETLGLALYSSADESDYTIETILSHGWWDDGVWELEDRRDLQAK